MVSARCLACALTRIIVAITRNHVSEQNHSKRAVASNILGIAHFISRRTRAYSSTSPCHFLLPHRVLLFCWPRIRAALLCAICRVRAHHLIFALLHSPLAHGVRGARACAPHLRAASALFSSPACLFASSSRNICRAARAASNAEVPRRLPARAPPRTQASMVGGQGMVAGGQAGNIRVGQHGKLILFTIIQATVSSNMS